MRPVATDPPTNRFLRTPEAAAYCGRSRSDFEKRRLRGDGPPFRKIGRVVIYDLADLDRWMEQHTLFLSTSEFPEASWVGSRSRAEEHSE